MMLRLVLVSVLAGCPTRKMVDDNGEYGRLFPNTPLSEAPCLEDQDCIVTHLKDGQCCPDPVYSASNLYTRDQFDRLIAHQAQICTESMATFSCAEHPPPPTHIDSVFKGQCVEQRCVIKKVPSDAPGAPEAPRPDTTPKKATPSVNPEPSRAPIPTAASPTP